MGSVCCQQQQEKPNGIIMTRVPIDQLSAEKCNKDQKLISKNSNEFKNKIIDPSQKYNFHRFLGKGNFGDVVQVQQKKTLKKYAMKIIEKQNLKQFNLLQSHLIQEISTKPHLVAIHQIFENQTRVYIIMELLPRGDIFFYNKQKIIQFEEKLIKQILAEIIVGIGILHSYGIIYRQLKPQNLLVTDEGHIKLNDYGLSKMIKGKNHTHTYVGPKEYSAPEVIRDDYGKQVDIWAIGILMYELRFRDTPFDSFKKKNHIQNKDQQNGTSEINIQQIILLKKKQVSQEFFDVLSSCLKQNPKYRITLEQLRKKPFFTGINWQQVEQLKNTPPFANIHNEDYLFRDRDPTNKELRPDRKIINNYLHKYQPKIYSFTSNSLSPNNHSG